LGGEKKELSTRDHTVGTKGNSGQGYLPGERVEKLSVEEREVDDKSPLMDTIPTLNIDERKGKRRPQKKLREEKAKSCAKTGYE